MSVAPVDFISQDAHLATQGLAPSVLHVLLGNTGQNALELLLGCAFFAQTVTRGFTGWGVVALVLGCVHRVLLVLGGSIPRVAFFL